ncbi:MAG: hypothetical protein J7M29_12225 [Verrucomicrobia bacterium]|nr:hypothetical protein [Verrucomicrobiota bacterium]
MRGLRRCIEAGLVVGVATSVCAGNIRTVCREAWLDRLIELGVHYVWYHGYRPAGPRPAPELALRPSQLLFMRRFIVEMRSRKPIIIVDPYYDHAGRSLCPMVTGVSHHINPSGGVEPCPVIQFAADWIDDPRGLRRLLVESRFLAAFREAAARTTRGCVLLERPELVAALAEEFGARDATLRGKAKAELARMTPRFSQWLPGREIPEKHWAYRWIKRLLFHDCGAYRGVAHEEEARALELARQLEKEPAAREAAPPARCGG